MKNKGFTLIELLIVIAIIGILATTAFYSLSSIKSKSRDARRVADIRAVQQGLSMYYNDNSLYPDSGGSAIEIDGSGDAMSQALIDEELMNSIPLDPFNKDVDGTVYKYYYESLDDESDYELTFYLETDSIQNRSQGENIVSP